MTYVPVTDDERKGAGRTPLDIPEALLNQLRHSDATGAVCVIELDGTESADDISELRRAIVRARYRFFAGKTINTRFSDTEIRYWVTPKKAGKRT